MRPDKIMIAVGIFILFIAVGTGFLFLRPTIDESGGLFVEYDVDASDSRFKNLTSNVDALYNTSSEMKADVMEEELEASTGWENMVIGGYKAFRQFTDLFRIAGQVFSSIIIYIGIPPIFFQVGMGAFLITLIFIVIYMVFRFQPRDD
jgi:hypothetical protein